MLPDDPLFDRIMWAVVRFVFLPVMLLMALGMVVLFFIGLAQLATGGTP